MIVPADSTMAPNQTRQFTDTERVVPIYVPRTALALVTDCQKLGLKELWAVSGTSSPLNNDSANSLNDLSALAQRARSDEPPS